MFRKPVFDAIRRLLSRPFRQREVEAIDRAFDEAEAAASPVAQTEPARRMGPAGIALVKQFEGCARKLPGGLFEAYPDPGSGGEPWTIGWGATGPGIARGTQWTAAQCDARLETDLARFAAEVAEAIGDAPTTQPQFDAMVSFHYNTGAIARATLTSKHRSGDRAGAAAEFLRWTRAGGKVLPGLERRRRAEAALYRSAPTG